VKQPRLLVVTNLATHSESPLLLLLRSFFLFSPQGRPARLHPFHGALGEAVPLTQRS